MYDLLSKYLAGDISAEERRMLFQQLKENEELRKEAAGIQNLSALVSMANEDGVASDRQYRLFVGMRKKSVVYDTAGHIFAQFEASKFRRDDVDEPDESVERCMACDLLILDDLGTEMTTAFVQSALYQLLNSRLLAGKSTIISTNLDPDQIGRRYSAQIMSRLEGEFELLPFIGQDIRRLKREQQR